jgi:hypothetical protein
MGTTMTKGIINIEIIMGIAIGITTGSTVTLDTHCCETMILVHSGCLPGRKNATNRQTDRHGRVHKVFFAHDRARRTVKEQVGFKTLVGKPEGKMVLNES